MPAQLLKAIHIPQTVPRPATTGRLPYISSFLNPPRTNIVNVRTNPPTNVTHFKWNIAYLADTSIRVLLLPVKIVVDS